MKPFIRSWARTFAALIAIVAAPVVPAEEGSFNALKCGSSKVTMLESRQGAMVLDLDQYWIVARSDNKTFQDMTERCFGVVGVVEGKGSGGGFCREVFLSGDTSLSEWHDTGPGTGTFVFVSGTGKLKGIQGSGTYKVVNMDTRPAAEGTGQACVEIHGKYTVAGQG